jgi:hypothetical protein
MLAVIFTSLLSLCGEMQGTHHSHRRARSRSFSGGVEENKARRYCLWQEWARAMLALDGKLPDNPC